MTKSEMKAKWDALAPKYKSLAPDALGEAFDIQDAANALGILGSLAAGEVNEGDADDVAQIAALIDALLDFIRNEKEDLLAGMSVDTPMPDMEMGTDGYGGGAGDLAALNLDSERAVVAYGSAVKSLDDGHIGGYLVRFGSPRDTDAEGDYFDASTDFGFKQGETMTTPVWLNHCEPMQTSSRKQIAMRQPIGEGTLSMDDHGILIDAVLYERKKYESILNQLGWSSGTAGHIVDAEPKGKALHIKRWLLGLDASLTPSPAEPRNSVIPLKSLTPRPQAEAEAAGAPAAPQATAAASEPVRNTKSSDSSQESQGEMEMAELQQVLDAVTALTAKVEAQAQELNSIKGLLPATNGSKDKTNIDVTPRDDRPFKSLGEQLQWVAMAANPDTRTDAMGRLAAVKSFNDTTHEKKFGIKATGLNENISSEGGFLVQTDFVTTIFERAYETGILAARCARQPIGPNANGVKIYGVDEQSRADGSRWGGVQAYWASEGGTLTKSKPKFYIIELNLKKLIALVYATDELLADAAALEGFVMRTLPLEIGFKVDDAILNGGGAGLPLGIMNAGALVSVSKEAGQAAATVLFANIQKMFYRLWAPSRAKAAWFINQDVEPQLNALSLTVGVGGAPVYLPPGGLNDAPNARLMGREVIPVEQCASVGTTGDIVLADLSQYILADKGGIQAAASMHVQFTTDEMTYRWVYRIDGQPGWHTALTPKNGSNTLSPYIALATRS